MRRISENIILILLLTATTVSAQNDTLRAENFRLPEVEVVDYYLPTPADSASLQLTAQISREQIAALPISTLSDLLAYLPALDVRSRGTGAAQTDVSLYGGTFDQVLIMLNGVPLSDVQTGHYSLNLPLSTELIERIEILQGTSAHLTGALCGAINIVTTRPENDLYTMAMSAGTNGDIHPVFAGSWARKDVRINTSAEYARSEGYYAPEANEKERLALHNSDYQLANVYFQTRWKGLDVQAGAQYKDAGLGTGYGYASTDQFDATRTMFVSARYAWSDNHGWHIDAQAAYRGNYDRYEWHRGTATNRHWTHNTQAALQAQYESVAGKTSLCAAFKDEYIRSTNMGTHNRLQASLSADHQYVWNQRLKVSLGVAGHYNSWFGWYGSGGAGIGYFFSHERSVSLTATRSLRMPTWTDLYYKAGVQRGSTDLKAEKAWQLALCGNYTWTDSQYGRLAIKGNIYYRWGQDIIDWTYDETDSLFHATNHNHVNTFGVEASVAYRLNDWLRNISVRYAYTYLSLDLTKAKSNYLDYLRHKIVLNIDHGIYVWSKGRFGADWSLRWQSRAGTYVNIYGVAGNPFTPVLLLDGSLFVELPHLRVAAECTNMTNRHYYDYGGILQPGIHGQISVKAYLNGK